ncbi:aminoglycoside phosphotransferase family protein [bacterium]|nr:MAG: aminoglycoside phosphotransferase family protein [bacterium]
MTLVNNRERPESPACKDAELYWPMPDVNMPQWLVPLSGYKPFVFSIGRVFKGSSLGAKIKRGCLCLMFRLCLLKYFLPKAVICRKADTSMIEEIRRIISDNSRGFARFFPDGASKARALVYIKQHAIGKYIYFICDENGKGSLVAKVFTRDSDASFLRAEYDNLRGIHSDFSGRGFLGAVPYPAYFGFISGRPVYMEEFCQGRDFREKIKTPEGGRYFSAAIEWLSSFHRATSRKGSLSLREQEEDFSRWYSENEPLLSAYFSYDALKRFMRSNFSSSIQDMPSVFWHRDFTHYNMLIGAKGISVLDWEYSQGAGLPLADALTFLAFYYTDSRKIPLFESLKELFCEGGGAAKEAARVIRDYNSALNIDGGCFPFLLLSVLRDVVKIKVERLSVNKSKEDILHFISFIINGKGRLISLN